MTNPTLLPFDLIQKAAESLTDLRVKSQLLAELAQSQFFMEQFDAALQTLAAIPSSLERRVALLTADYQHFPPEKIGALVQLIESDPRTQFLAGNLALSMLEANNLHSAWTLIETVKEGFAFESEPQRFEFLERVLPQSEEGDWEKILRFRETFTEEPYTDWAALALAKHLVGGKREGTVEKAEMAERLARAEKLLGALSSPLRCSWAYWELCQLLPPEWAENFFDKAIKIIETIEVNSEEEEMEKLAIGLRILGRAAVQRGNTEKGEQLLERSESPIASLKVSLQRYRLQCFLGKVLCELKLIGSIREYVPIDTMLESISSGADRSRVLVWLAEAGWTEGWSRAINVSATPERGILESDRAEQITGVLKRLVAHHRGTKATGHPAEDTVGVSGEEFETFYFSPFAEADCGC